MIDVIFKEPEGLNKSGKKKWNAEVFKRKYQYDGDHERVILRDLPVIPNLSYNHFTDHNHYHKFTKDRDEWNYYSHFFSGMSSNSIAELFFNIEQNWGNIEGESEQGKFIRTLLETIKCMNDNIRNLEREIESLKDSIRELEWSARQA